MTTRDLVLLAPDDENKVIATIIAKDLKLEVINQKIIDALSDHFAVIDIVLDFNISDVMVDLDSVNQVNVMFKSNKDNYDIQIEPAWIY